MLHGKENFFYQQRIKNEDVLRLPELTVEKPLMINKYLPRR